MKNFCLSILFPCLYVIYLGKVSWHCLVREILICITSFEPLGSFFALLTQCFCTLYQTLFYYFSSLKSKLISDGVKIVFTILVLIDFDHVKESPQFSTEKPQSKKTQQITWVALAQISLLPTVFMYSRAAAAFGDVRSLAALIALVMAIGNWKALAAKKLESIFWWYLPSVAGTREAISGL